MDHQIVGIMDIDCHLPVGEMLIGQHKIPVADLLVALQVGMNSKEIIHLKPSGGEPLGIVAANLIQLCQRLDFTLIPTVICG